MELDSRILAYVAYRASRSALVRQLNEINLTIQALSEAMKKLDLSAEKKAEINRFFNEAQADFGRMLKEVALKTRADALATAQAYLKDSGDGKREDSKVP